MLAVLAKEAWATLMTLVLHLGLLTRRTVLVLWKVGHQVSHGSGLRFPINGSIIKSEEILP